MKNELSYLTVYLLTVLFLIFIIRCTKEKTKGCRDSTALNYNSDASEDDGSCAYNGQILFWSGGVSCDGSQCSHTIKIEGNIIGTTTQFFTTAPTCNASGCVIYTNKPEIYNWSSNNICTLSSGSYSYFGTKTGVVTFCIKRVYPDKS